MERPDATIGARSENHEAPDRRERSELPVMIEHFALRLFVRVGIAGIRRNLSGCGKFLLRPNPGDAICEEPGPQIEAFGIPEPGRRLQDFEWLGGEMEPAGAGSFFALHFRPRNGDGYPFGEEELAGAD